MILTKTSHRLLWQLHQHGEMTRTALKIASSLKESVAKAEIDRLIDEGAIEIVRVDRDGNRGRPSVWLRVVDGVEVERIESRLRRRSGWTVRNYGAADLRADDPLGDIDSSTSFVLQLSNYVTARYGDEPTALREVLTQAPASWQTATEDEVLQAVRVAILHYGYLWPNFYGDELQVSASDAMLAEMRMQGKRKFVKSVKQGICSLWGWSLT
jgi:hypothetical protein